MSEADSASDSGSEHDTHTGEKRKRGRPELVPLEPYKDYIIKSFTEDNIPIIEIARNLNVNHGLDISERTISRRLTAWNVPRKKTRSVPAQHMIERITFHYNKNLSDEQIVAELFKEGYTMKLRNLSRLRQKLGMRRRSKYPEFREASEEREMAQNAQSAEDSGQTLLPDPPMSSSPKRPKKKAKKNYNTALIPKVTTFVEKYMSKYDGSHDFNHIRRVVGLAHLIYTDINKEEGEDAPDLDLHVITLAALLHDVGDKKYLEPGQNPNTLVLVTLLGLGAPEDLAVKVQRIVTGVSYSSEVKDPGVVLGLIQKYPELAVVQDADRLDAIGAVGIGRTFTFGGAKGAKDMGETVQHFEDKLEKLEGMMKTSPGKRMAKERTERLMTFKCWWEEEQKDAEGLLKRK